MPFLIQTAAQARVPGTSDDIGRVDPSKAKRKFRTVLVFLSAAGQRSIR